METPILADLLEDLAVAGTEISTDRDEAVATEVNVVLAVVVAAVADLAVVRAAVEADSVVDETVSKKVLDFKLFV